MRYINLLCILMAALSTTSRTYAQQPINTKDSLALIDFYNACNGPNWSPSTWTLENPVAAWSGITVVGDRVTGLWLHENFVGGQIPESFGNLTSLESLILDYNGIHLPESLGNLTNLHTINVRGNFIPSIPASIGNLINLKELNLGENHGLNSLPESIGKLTNLTTLYLDDCQLTDLPESLINLTSLQKLRLEYNNLSFTDLEPIVAIFPSTVSIVYSPQLMFKLVKEDDKLVASVGGTPQNNTFYWYRDDMLIATNTADSTYSPSLPGKYRVEVTNAVVTQLRLKSSVIAHPPVNITLTCPPDTTLEAGEAESTAVVIGIDPMLTGTTISDVIYTVSGASTGTGPGTASGQPFNRGVSTVTYTLSSDASMNCAFTLTVEDFNAPPGVNVHDSLALVDLYDSTNGTNWNKNYGWKQGPVSTWYGVDVLDGRVTQLTLFQNNLVGSVPESFGNLTKLNTLYLPFNQLSALPETFGNLTKLNYSMLAFNQLTSLPASIGNLTNLQTLVLTNNQLSSLPESVGKLTSLIYLILGFNKLSAIPESIANLTTLQEVDLSNNQLTSLPETFGNLTNLEHLRLEDNQLSSLSESFGNLTRLSWLQLENNQLSSLPASFGNLTNLFTLRLSNNQLTTLPTSFGNLTSVGFLFLENNQLSALPESFEKLIISFNPFGRLTMSKNKFTFAELEWIVKAFPSTATIIYAPQDTFKLTQQGNTLIAAVGGTPQNNTFYWYRDNILETTIQADSTYTATKAGNHRVKVTNAVATELRLISDVIAYGPGTITLTCPADTIVTTDSNVCTAIVNGIDPMVTGAAIADVMYTLSGATTGSGTGTASGQSFNTGTTTVSYTLSSDASVNCAFTVRVEDKEAPVITTASATASVLWPANHKLQDVVINYSISDNCGSTTVLSVSGNDGATNSDWQMVDAHHVQLRAERSGSGEGRTYVITIMATDASGNMSTQSVNVVVPHDMPKKSKNDLQVLVLPNPSKNDFTLRVHSTSHLPVVVRVSNAVGKTIETIQNTTTKGTLRLGSNYPAGAYYAEVVQGSSRAVVKLLKLPQ
jgi:Leucine-rich repeat (LRR) protein